MRLKLRSETREIFLERKKFADKNNDNEMIDAERPPPPTAPCACVRAHE